MVYRNARVAKSCAYQVRSSTPSGYGAMTVCKPTLAAARTAARTKAKKNWKLYVEVVRASTGATVTTCVAGECRNLTKAALVRNRHENTLRSRRAAVAANEEFMDNYDVRGVAGRKKRKTRR